MRNKSTTPAWLWFTLYNHMTPKHEWTDEKTDLAAMIILSLKAHLIFFGKSDPVITEPNNFDDNNIYGKKNNPTS